MIRSEFFPRSYFWQAIRYKKENLETPLATLDLFLLVSLGLSYHFALTGLSMDLTSAPALLLLLHLCSQLPFPQEHLSSWCFLPPSLLLFPAEL